MHDCDCRHLYCQSDRLVFEMEWMEILRDHPLNLFSQAHQSGEGRIELIAPKIVECTLAVNGSEEICAVEDVRKLDHYELEILDFEEEDRVEESGVYRAKIYMLFGRDSRFRDISLTVEYSGSLVMWNDWNGVSWFEELKWQQDK